ncbi:NifB/NifX family molybdenum-iron cluster-binding protein [Calorimonas adulescens]|uniref:Dinitrogenase iron-molybdenum cofactor biosynthesis domain-containing protein n=1 Tax=Calorimonas adulescens TaxID=2606906 RepID=A0A5D8QHJ9_9THEO|nr:NifB/NifX family molybdenum-iron cluster-binding protein [Calorimonas adulescens]TZE82768.1 hypothetical protein FWJ32_03980 [Calorimonas adulescens]
MKIAFASKNHLGLNSEVGTSISGSEYFTVADIEDKELKKVQNIENIFYGHQNIDDNEFIKFIQSLKIDKLVLFKIDDPAVKEKLSKNNISVIEGANGRIADVLNSFD